MDLTDEEEPLVTIYRLYKQLVEMPNLPVRKIPVFDSGELAGEMFKGIDDLTFEKQYQVLRRTLREPYVEPNICLWMYRSVITPLEICSLVRDQGVFIEEDRDQCLLIDFDHWADANEKLRGLGVILPGDFNPNANDRMRSRSKLHCTTIESMRISRTLRARPAQSRFPRDLRGACQSRLDAGRL